MGSLAATALARAAREAYFQMLTRWSAPAPERWSSTRSRRRWPDSSGGRPRLSMSPPTTHLAQVTRMRAAGPARRRRSPAAPATGAAVRSVEANDLARGAPSPERGSWVLDGGGGGHPGAAGQEAGQRGSEPFRARRVRLRELPAAAHHPQRPNAAARQLRQPGVVDQVMLVHRRPPRYRPRYKAVPPVTTGGKVTGRPGPCNASGGHHRPGSGIGDRGLGGVENPGSRSRGS